MLGGPRFGRTLLLEMLAARATPAYSGRVGWLERRGAAFLLGLLAALGLAAAARGDEPKLAPILSPAQGALPRAPGRMTPALADVAQTARPISRAAPRCG